MKNIAFLTLLITTSKTSAFTIPHGSAYSKPGALYLPPPTPRTALNTATGTGLQMKRNSFDRAVEVNAAGKIGTIESIEEYAAETMMRTPDEIPTHTAGLAGFALLLFSGIARQLQVYLNEPCLNGGNVCTEEYRMFAQFFNDHELLSFGLILTHAIPFALIPYAMKQINDKGPLIKADHPKFNPFLMSMAMACTAFGLALEFGWHVADSWYYDNNFHILNFGFYFFLISSFALWADAFESNAKMDVLFGAILLFATALYPIGNGIQVGVEVPAALSFLENAEVAKIPLYIGMTVTFTSLTIRGQKIFGFDMWKVFFLSVVVNLAFIFKLAGYAYTDGTTELSVENYIYHICHDVLGTEAGVFYFATLVRDYKPLNKITSSSEN